MCARSGVGAEDSQVDGLMCGMAHINVVGDRDDHVNGQTSCKVDGQMNARSMPEKDGETSESVASGDGHTSGMVHTDGVVNEDTQVDWQMCGRVHFEVGAKDDQMVLGAGDVPDEGHQEVQPGQGAFLEQEHSQQVKQEGVLGHGGQVGDQTAVQHGPVQQERVLGQGGHVGDQAVEVQHGPFHHRGVLEQAGQVGDQAVGVQHGPVQQEGVLGQAGQGGDQGVGVQHQPVPQQGVLVQAGRVGDQGVGVHDGEKFENDIRVDGGTVDRVSNDCVGFEHTHVVTVGSCAKPIGKIKKRVWGVKKNGLYGWKMKMVVAEDTKMTPKKTTPNEKLTRRGPGLVFHASKLAEELTSKKEPNGKCAAEQNTKGNQILVSPAKVSRQFELKNEKLFTKPQQVYSSAVIQKPDEQECTSPFNQWEDSIGIRDGAVWPIRGRDQDFEMRTTSHCQK